MTMHIDVVMPKLHNSYLGIFIHDPHTPITYTKIQSKAMNCLGFVSYEEYVEAYPGKMLNVTNAMNQSLSMRSRKKRRKKNKRKSEVEVKSLCDDFYTLDVLLFNEKDTIRNRIIGMARQACKSDYMSMFMVATPPIKQLKRVNGFTTAKPKDFWFCCDWQDRYAYKDKL